MADKKTKQSGKKKTENKQTVQVVPEDKAVAVINEEIIANDQPSEMENLRKSVENARAVQIHALTEAEKMKQEAKTLIKTSNVAYLSALIPYKSACKEAGIECEFQASRGVSISDRVAFLVERVPDGINVTIKGRPETMETIMNTALEHSVNKAAYGYVEKHLGTKAQVGNKGGGLSNRLRRVWR